MTLSSAAQGTAHDYFNTWKASQYHLRSFHLRSQAEIDTLRHLSSTPEMANYIYPNDAFFDKQDAVKIIVPTATQSFDQLRMNVSVGAEWLGVQQVKVLLIWDYYWDESFIDAHVTYGFNDNKAFQCARHNKAIHWEPRLMYIGQGGYIGYANVRYYPTGALPPGTTLGGAGAIYEGVNMGSDSLGPLTGIFRIVPNIWTRWWAELIFTAGSSTVTTSLWVADETRDATEIIRNIDVHWPEGNGVANARMCHQFWFEGDISSGATDTAYTAYGRNVLMLRDVPDPTATFARPIR
jgi:hypothetical protein